MAVVHAVSDLLGREPEVHRTEHHAGLVARQIGEHKLRAVVELHHDNVTFPHSGTEQSEGETVSRCKQQGKEKQKFPIQWKPLQFLTVSRGNSLSFLFKYVTIYTNKLQSVTNWLQYSTHSIT